MEKEDDSTRKENGCTNKTDKGGFTGSYEETETPKPEESSPVSPGKKEVDGHPNAADKCDK
jgi:hypothetical protein